MNVPLDFFSVERAQAGAHKAPGAQTSLYGAQIEKKIYIFSTDESPSWDPKCEKGPSWGPWGPWVPYFKNIIYIFFPLERAPAGAQKVYRENSQQFLSMESRHFDYIIASEKFNKFLEGKFNIFC